MAGTRRSGTAERVTPLLTPDGARPARLTVTYLLARRDLPVCALPRLPLQPLHHTEVGLVDKRAVELVELDQ